jgi:cell division protein ZapA
MACEDGEEDRLGGLGRALDDKLREMKATFGEIGDQRLTVMAALAIADELEEARNRLAGAMAELESARSSALGDSERAQARDAELAVAIDLASERLEQLTREMGEASRET